LDGLIAFHGNSTINGSCICYPCEDPTMFGQLSIKEQFEMLQKQRLVMPDHQQKVYDAKKTDHYPFWTTWKQKLSSLMYIPTVFESKRCNSSKMAKQINTRLRLIPEIVDLASNNKI
jgi:hypothetical protein